MRIVKALIALTAVLAVVPIPAHAKKAKAATAAAAQPTATAPVPATATPAKPTEVTQALGTLPDWFAGTWLCIRQIKTGKQYRNAWTAYRISHTDSTWQTNQLAGPTPQALQDALRAANTANMPLQLDAAALDAAKPMTATLTPPAVEERSQEIFLRDAQNLRPDDTLPAEAQETKYVLEFLTRGGMNTVAAAWSYYVTEATPDKMSGVASFASVTFGAGVVAPINISGGFVMYRLQ